jgi:hypothetical protein
VPKNGSKVRKLQVKLSTKENRKHCRRKAHNGGFTKKGVQVSAKQRMLGSSPHALRMFPCDDFDKRHSLSHLLSFVEHIQLSFLPFTWHLAGPCCQTGGKLFFHPAECTFIQIHQLVARRSVSTLTDSWVF